MTMPSAEFLKLAEEVMNEWAAADPGFQAICRDFARTPKRSQGRQKPKKRKGRRCATK